MQNNNPYGVTTLEQVRQHFAPVNRGCVMWLEQAAYEVQKANPKAKGQDYINLVCETVMKNAANGIGPCD